MPQPVEVLIHQPEVGTSLLQGMSYCFYEVMDHRTGPGEEFHATTGASEDLGTKTHADGQYHVLWHADKIKVHRMPQWPFRSAALRRRDYTGRLRFP